MSLDVLFVGVEVNSSRLLLKEGVRLVVGFCGEGDGWFWGGGGGSLVGTWTGFDLCVGLQLIDFTLLVRGMQAVIERVGLNNSGLLLQAEVWLVEGLIGRESGLGRTIGGNMGWARGGCGAK